MPLTPLFDFDGTITTRDTMLPFVHHVRGTLRTLAGLAWLAPMLAAYTINAAYATHMERETGSLAPGRLGDMIVIDRNLFTVPVTEIHAARVVLTLLEGKPVWSDSTLAAP